MECKNCLKTQNEDFDFCPECGAKVIRKRLVPSSGIEFDIHFPSNRPGYRSINYVSSGVGGLGALIGFDISGYKTFALKFTLVSIDGKTGSDINQELVAGALIGPTVEGKLSDYTPFVHIVFLFLSNK